METGTAITESDRSAAIIQGLGEAAILLDGTGIVTHVNEAAAPILGVERDHIVGRALDHEFDDRGLGYARMHAAFDRAATLPAGEQQSELSLNVHGREHTYLLKPAPLRLANGRLFGTLIIFYDITELREKRRVQDGAVAAAAHELNTPLTSISLAVDLLGRNTKKQQELIDAVLEDVERLRQVSATFVSVVREQPRSITVQSVDFDLGKPGVPAQIRELVFRHSARRSTEVLGGSAVGLALVLAKEVAEAHGGSLFAEAAESGGMVTLKLPLSQDT